ncbi:hypothetical protein M1N65_01365, partial [Thermodesulfovibrionales bacterium]|nr:hypothetical protein [Thermodesulfovibrionales bacterium]
FLSQGGGTAGDNYGRYLSLRLAVHQHSVACSSSSHDISPDSHVASESAVVKKKAIKWGVALLFIIY